MSVKGLSDPLVSKITTGIALSSQEVILAKSMQPERTKLLSEADLVGTPVTNFVRALCAYRSDIAEVRFRTYIVGPGLGERLEKKKLLPQELVSTAKAAAKESQRDFWDALAGIVMREGKHLPRVVYEEALTHSHGESERTFIFTRQEILDGRIDSITSHLGDQDGLSLCSEVRLLAGYNVHIPMLDFSCKPTESNQAAISDMLSVTEQVGVIAESGNSFHFLGMSLLTYDAWVRFMGRSLLLSPFVDARFEGHRLIDGECRLRIFAQDKKPKIPLIVACVH